MGKKGVRQAGRHERSPSHRFTQTLGKQGVLPLPGAADLQIGPKQPGRGQLQSPPGWGVNGGQERMSPLPIGEMRAKCKEAKPDWC